MAKKPDVKTAYKARMETDTAHFHKNRERYLKAVLACGIDGTLDALGFPKERTAIYYNINTGHEETLETLITRSFTGPIVGKKEQTQQLAYTLENWLPMIDGHNPIMERARAYTEEQVQIRAGKLLQRNLAEVTTPEIFIKSLRENGGTFEDGSYDIRPTRGKMKVILHDDREFTFSLRSIYQFIKGRETQPALF